MTHIIKRKLKNLLLTHPKPDGISLSYDRDGFRARADALPWIMVRIGLLAAIRSKVKQACIGVMITASHYPEDNNGVRIIESNGEVLDKTWEVYANELTMIEDDAEKLWIYLDKLMSRFNIHPNHDAIIGIAHDTRSSSLPLASIVKHAAQTLHTIILDFELMTTPQLHCAIYSYNNDNFSTQYTETGYFNKILRAFLNIMNMCLVAPTNKLEPIFVDAANGVGASKLAILSQKLEKFISINIFNDGTKGSIHENCGVDYVKLNQRAPDTVPLAMGAKYCSIDGDADRLIYFFIDSRTQFQVLVGDRFSVLFAVFIGRKLREAKFARDVKVAVIQTFGANGGSTAYITNHLKIPVIYAKPNTKCLRHKAREYDVGIYFESDGHGTVHFSNDFKNKVNTCAEDVRRTTEERLAAKQIRAFISIINENIGDAIANLLATEAALVMLNFNQSKWLDLYNDLPQRQLKIHAPDLSMIQISDVDYRCTAPIHLQDRINDIVSKYGFARAFIRPSDNRNALFVFAEAVTQKQADKLAEEVRGVVEEFITMIVEF